MTTPSTSQWKNLRKRLVYAQEHIPLYRRLWADAGVDIRSIDSAERFRELPLLTKRDLLNVEPAARLDPRYAATKLRALSTSGSTGEPLSLLFDKSTLRRRQWLFLRALWQSGYRPGQRVMLVSSRPSHSLKRVSPAARLMRWHYVDLYVGQAELLRAYQEIAPQLLYAPLNALLMLGESLHGSGCSHRPRIVVSTSEQLTPGARRQIEHHFGATVTDFYGLTEAGLLAWSPADSASYRLGAKDMYLEFIPQQDVQGCEQLVVTDLRDVSMPLIRYQTGDLVRREQSRQGAVVVEFVGKQLDFLRLPDGQRIAPYEVDRVLGEIDGLLRYEVLQRQDLQLDVRVQAVAPGVVAVVSAALETLCGGQLKIGIAELPASGDSFAHKARPVRSLAGSAA